MMRLDSSKVASWTGQNSSHKNNPPYVPTRIDAGCPVCAASFVNIMAELAWSGLRGGKAMSSHIQCRGCKTDVHLLLFDPPQSKTEDAYDAAKLFMHPESPILPNLRTRYARLEALSPTFVAAYEQSALAERLGLAHLYGMGMRKALEFLIKDYLIHRSPDDQEKIAKKLLGRCIAEHVDNTRIKNAAKMTAWLGNDATHFERRWEDMNTDDLEALLKITASWIDMELEADEYEATMLNKS